MVEAWFAIILPLNEYLVAALRKKDYMLGIQLMKRAERIISEHVKAEFELLVPMQVKLRRLLARARRFARRELIRRALTCSKEEHELYLGVIQDLLQTDGFQEDFDYVRAALAEGRPISSKDGR
jgi:hypothetical protein